MKTLIAILFVAASLNLYADEKAQAFASQSITQWTESGQIVLGYCSQAVKRGLTPQLRSDINRTLKQRDELAKQILDSESSYAWTPSELLAYRKTLVEINNAFDKKIAQFDSLISARDSGPRQYNGQPLPLNWIDPKEADARFLQQQNAARLYQLQQQLEQLQNQNRR